MSWVRTPTLAKTFFIIFKSKTSNGSPVKFGLNLEIIIINPVLLPLETQCYVVYHNKNPPKSTLGNFRFDRICKGRLSATFGHYTGIYIWEIH